MDQAINMFNRGFLVFQGGKLTNKIFTLLSAFLLAFQVHAQSSADSVLVTFRTYKPSSPTVYVPGQFNNWGNNVGGNIPNGDPSAMVYDNELGAWTKSYTFKIKDPADTRRSLGDSVFQYKFNQGGSSSGWYSDPLNPEQNSSDNNNSVLRLTKLFWFQFAPTEASGRIARITAGLGHANNQTITAITLTTGVTRNSSLTTTDVTSYYNEGSRILDFALLSPIPREYYIRLVAYGSGGDSVVFSRGGFVVNVIAMPSYAQHGITLPSTLSNDSTTFRIRVSGKDNILLRVAPLGQPVANASPIQMRKAPDNVNWWVNVGLPTGTYEYVYEIENGKQIYDPWGRFNGTNGSRFTVGPEGLTADDYVWQSVNYQRPPLNRLVIYEMHIGEFAGGYYNKPAGTATFNDLATLIPYLDSLGINAIELMPINDFGSVGRSGNSWGYDVNSYFALEPGYGNPRDFKSLVDTAHAHGIAVIVDVVYNHMNDTGPLWQMQPDEVTSPYFKFCNDLRPNEDQLCFFKDLDHWTSETQELIYAALKMWIDDYRVDGFRFDYTQGIGWDINSPTKGILGWANRIGREYNGAVYQIAEHLPESPALLSYSGLTSGWHDSYHDEVFKDLIPSQRPPLVNFENLVLDLGAYPGNDTPSSPGTYSDRTEPVNANVNHDEQSLIYEMTTFQGVALSDAIQRDKVYATSMFASLGIPMLWEGMEFSAPRGWLNSGQKLSYRPVEWYLYPTARGQAHYKYYKSLIRQRTRNPALFAGVLRKLFRYDTERVLVWGFEDPPSGWKFMAVSNLSGAQQSLSNVPWLGSGDWYDILDQTIFSVSGTTIPALSIPAYTARMYSNKPDSMLWPLPTPSGQIPKDFELAQNYPNPFNPTTVISYQLPVVSDVKLVVFDVLGREVAVLVNERKAPGSYEVRFAGSNLASGVYFYRLTVALASGENRFLMKKMMLLR